MRSTLHIELSHRLVGQGTSARSIIAPEAYFELEPDESLELDCLPKHNHACSYLGIERKRLEGTSIILREEPSGRTRTIRESYWGVGRHAMIERVDKDQEGKTTYRLVILTTETQEEPRTLQIIRLIDAEGGLLVDSHSVARVAADGSESWAVEYGD